MNRAAKLLLVNENGNRSAATGAFCRLVVVAHEAVAVLLREGARHRNANEQEEDRNPFQG